MKKKTIIITAVIIISLAFAVKLCFNDYTNIYLNNSHAAIAFADSYYYTIGLVTQEGNCYVKGSLSDEENYGVDKVPPSWLLLNDYLKIYDKCDAEAIDLTAEGGTIITRTHDVYLFLNRQEKYHVPTLLTSGYTQACAWDQSHIYLLTESHDFGYVSSDNPDAFHLIMTNVEKFVIEQKTAEQGAVALVLTNNHQLFVLEGDNIKPDEHIDHIIDFDVLCPHIGLSVISLLRDDHHAFCIIGDNELSYETLSDQSLYQECGSEINSVESYNRGIAMKDYRDRVFLYGDDFHFKNTTLPNYDFHGECVFTDVSSVYGGDYNLIVINNSAQFTVYGRDPYTTDYSSIVSD